MTNEGVKIFKRFYNSSEAANYIGYSRSHLSNLRMRGEGPKFKKLNSGRIVYDREWLDEWVKGDHTDE